MRTSALKKTAAFFQITAMVLLQLYAVAPLLSSDFAVQAQVMRCNGNHAQCGCSPSRIASQTCCCFQSKQLVKTSSTAADTSHTESETLDADKPDCCPKAAQPTVAGNSPRNNLASNPGALKTGPLTKDKQGRTLPTVCAVPCGSDPAVIITSLEDIKFLCASIPSTVPTAFSSDYYHPRSTLFQSRFLEPPDPPPRLSPSLLS